MKPILEKVYIFFWIPFCCILSVVQAEKKIIFKSIHCPLRSNKVAKVQCFLEDKIALTVEIETNNIEIVDLVGVSDLNLNIYGQKGAMRFKGLRLELCNLFENSLRTNLLTLLLKGIRQTDNNLPKKCPFQRNNTYKLRHMKFDANYLPSYLPEYNFTFTGRFYANQVNTFEVRVVGSFCNIDNNCMGAI